MKASLPLIGALFATGLSPAAAAAPRADHHQLDLYGSYSLVDSDALTDTLDGIGGGVRLRAQLPWRLYVTGEYSRVRPMHAYYDPVYQFNYDFELALTEYRGGLGLALLESPKHRATVRAEYLALKSEYRITNYYSYGEITDDGVGVHLTDLLRFGRQGEFAVYGEAGYLSTANFSGPQLMMGSSWIPEVAGWFAELRYQNLESDFETRAEYRINVGVRLLFEDQ